MRTQDNNIPQQGHSFSIIALKDTKERKRSDDILKYLLVKMKSDLKQKTRFKRMKRPTEYFKRKKASNREEKGRKEVEKVSNMNGRKVSKMQK